MTLKQSLKAISYKIASPEPVLEIFRKANLIGNVIVLMYHEIAEDDKDIEAWTVVRKSDFIRQMRYLKDHFRIISLREALGIMDNGERSTRPVVVVTFDDGYSGNNRLLLPILESMSIPVTIFIATLAVQDMNLYWYDQLISALQGDEVIDYEHPLLGRFRFNESRGAMNWSRIETFLETLKRLDPQTRYTVVQDILKFLKRSDGIRDFPFNPLTVDELRELAKSPLVSIGAHSHRHEILTQLSETEARDTIRTSKELLETWIERPVSYFAYPNGDYNDHIIEILKEEGFACGLTTEGRPWSKMDSLFKIPRLGIGRYETFDIFKLRVANVLNNALGLRTKMGKMFSSFQVRKSNV